METGQWTEADEEELNNECKKIEKEATINALIASIPTIIMGIIVIILVLNQ